ncbi:hypothetical protein [Zobellella denitrificans]
MNNNTSIVQQAADCFKQGDYKAACSLYKQAAEKYGQALFSANIRLCEKRLTEKSGANPLSNISPEIIAASSLEQQLQQTQQLLEKYYTRAQELEYQLLDR